MVICPLFLAETAAAPLIFAAALSALTVLALGINLAARARRGTALALLAGTWGMRYVGRDPFRLAPRINERFPVPGAADLCVGDLIYGSEPGRHRYLFTLRYTQGVVRTKRRCRRVATFSEPVDAHEAVAQDAASALQLAPAHLPLIEQYTHLRDMLARERKSC